MDRGPKKSRAVILREVAGSTLGNDVVAGVDCATARGMTGLGGRLPGDAVDSSQIGDDTFHARRDLLRHPAQSRRIHAPQ